MIVLMLPFELQNISLLEAAKKGLGYIHMTRHNVVSAVDKGELIEVLPEYAGPLQDISICYHRAPFVPRKISAFIEFAQKYYADKF